MSKRKLKSRIYQRERTFAHEIMRQMLSRDFIIQVTVLL